MPSMELLLVEWLQGNCFFLPALPLAGHFLEGRVPCQAQLSLGIFPRWEG